MKSLVRTLFPAAALVAALAPAAAATGPLPATLPPPAPCATGANGGGWNGGGWNGGGWNGGWWDGGWWDGDGGVLLSRPIGLFFEAPLGGYTLYPGQAGSGVASASDYSHINYHTPPVVTARAVF